MDVNKFGEVYSMLLKLWKFCSNLHMHCSHACQKLSPLNFCVTSLDAIECAKKAINILQCQDDMRKCPQIFAQFSDDLCTLGRSSLQTCFCNIPLFGGVSFPRGISKQNYPSKLYAASIRWRNTPQIILEKIANIQPIQMQAHCHKSEAKI